MNRISIAASALLLALASCSDILTDPGLNEDDADLLPDTETSFLTCPTKTESSVTGTIGALGGALAVAGHRFTLPPLAVVENTAFTMTAPASKHVELEIHAHDHDSFEFLVPAEITISYDRCEDQDIDHDALTVWYIDGLTGELLELMGGVADPETRAITFDSDHLSGFIIAN